MARLINFLLWHLRYEDSNAVTVLATALLGSSRGRGGQGRQGGQGGLLYAINSPSTPPASPSSPSSPRSLLASRIAAKSVNHCYTNGEYRQFGVIP